MGVDACIYLKSRTGKEPTLYDPLMYADIIEANGRGPEGCTHEIEQFRRYYGPGYERGPWPKLASILLTLLASEDVETVWYFGDDQDFDIPFTLERLEQFNKYYVESGNRPYRGAFK